MTDYSDSTVRVEEKQASRDQDMQALAERRTTPEQLHEENTAIRLSGERINFAESTSDWW